MILGIGAVFQPAVDIEIKNPLPGDQLRLEACLIRAGRRAGLFEKPTTVIRPIDVDDCVDCELDQDE
jgi:hypothetical protein